MSLIVLRSKVAAPAHAAPLGPEMVQMNREATQGAMGDIRRTMLGGAGLGATGAGLIALKNWLLQPKPPTAALGMGPNEVDLAYPQFEGVDVGKAEARELKKRKALADREKAASPGAEMLQANHDQLMAKLLPPATLRRVAPEVVARLEAREKQAKDITYTDPKTGQRVTEDHEQLGRKMAQKLQAAAAGDKDAELLHDAMVDNLTKFAGDPKPAPGMFTPDWFMGKGTSQKTEMPWYPPAITLAGIGSVAGGAGLVSWLANKRRKAQQKAEADDAKREFEEAMLSQYDPTKTHRLLSPKVAGDTASLDGIFDRCKAAGLGKKAEGLLGGLTGGYLTLASLLGLGTGYGTYNYLQDRSKSKRLEQALKDRAAVRATMNPPEMFIHPVAARKKRPLGEEAEAAVSPTL